MRPRSSGCSADGIDARGPLPADTLFHARARATYDAALCMYHDQALIPIKTLAFDHAVNVTLGLPFVRTSPDHGTAFDIAGTGRADPSSLIAAIRLAARLAMAESRRFARRDMTGANDDLPPLREVIRRHGLSAKKSLGQNFLLDLNLTARIARAGGPLDGVTVVEVGPGPGGLTRALLAHGARRVIAIERDERAIAALQEIAAHYPGRLEIVMPGDALELRSCARVLRRRRQRASSPTCPTISRPRCWSAGSPSSHGRPGTTAGADVPARGRRAHRRRARIEDLWPPCRARQLALRGEDPVRRRAVGLRAAAEGHLVGGAARAARGAAACDRRRSSA